MKQTATRFVPMIEKKSEKSEKKCNKCNKGILYAVWWFIVKQLDKPLQFVSQ